MQQRDSHVTGLRKRQRVEDELLGALPARARSPDLDLGQPQDPVDRRGGELDGAHPVERRGQHLPAEQSALELDLRRGDPVASGQVADHPEGHRNGDSEELPVVAVTVVAQDEGADHEGEEPDQLLHGIDQQHPRVEPLPRQRFDDRSRWLEVHGLRLLWRRVLWLWTLWLWTL